MTKKDNSFNGLYDLGKQIVQIPNMSYIDSIRKNIVSKIKEFGKIQSDDTDEYILNNCHKFIDANRLNELRIQIMNFLNEDSKSKNLYYEAFRPIIEKIIGCDTAVQKRINLVVQYPNHNEITPIHSDVEGGDSPFEITIWMPLTNVYGTKGMYCLDKSFGGSITGLVKKEKKDLQQLVNEYVKQEHFTEMDYGNALLFNPFLLHGNKINTTKETRFALNWRIKSIFTPYSFKALGEYFEVFEISPHTKLAMEYYKENFDGMNGPKYLNE